MFQKIQGAFSEKLFHGFSTNKTIKLIYGESSKLFSDIIKNEFKKGKYTLLDIGSHKGELLRDLMLNLTEYDFNTTAIDLDNLDLNKNIADYKIISDAKQIPLENKKFDITISRYVLAWNSLEDQIKIISEIKRLTKGIAIIQHQGADKKNPDELQISSHKLFSGIVELLERKDFYFSTEAEIEGILKKENIKYKIIQSRKINGLAELLIEKYSLQDNDAKKTKETLKNSDYIIQSTFILDFRS
ncbi:hypothetical protein A2996_02190 [Candidatus Campbellbacteria bacterium RIFCSPLOWO2_01_FULL_34_15]|uniref:Methyltransferase type 11 domain-containing protein n=2 Tax=Candidatus Campbelliibacteriota TaxID=1752727 RepID=A0A1F5ENR4_9BACT|nr:MAG: hypothetical protein A3E89_01435 [Candidatus Campbellbacteria bacterium RIFCSPHIGHO2_12_FULL_35_10]OGD69049.1 MAG: hypothetical protein A2996_02190 [Candidatus Campbellbacteria bacterium RIFCSPLOWO2_01_FULL_34_15]HLD38358.1 methyltransferase domain-containing protein [Candidatus Nanoarchaeia archaeon]